MTPELPKQVEIPPPPILPKTTAANEGALPLVGQNVAIGVRQRVVVPGARPPSAMTCLQCQLIGRRRMLCSKADGCAELPHSFALGPILLGAWLVTAIAFVAAVLGP